MRSQKITSHKTITNRTVTQKAAGPTAKKVSGKRVALKKDTPKGMVEKIAAEETDTLRMFVRTYALF